MAYPDKPTIDTSYTAFQQSQGGSSFPGTSVDNDLANLKTSLDATIDFLKRIATAKYQIATLAVPTTPDVSAYVGAIQTAVTDCENAALAAQASETAAAASASATATTLTGYLAKADNLSGLSSVASARNNLGLGTAAVTNAVDYATAAQGVKADSALQLTTAGLVVGRTYGSYTANADLTTTVPIDDTTPTSTEGTELISVSYTPKTATNRIRLTFRGGIASGSTPIVGVASIFAGSTNLATGSCMIVSSVGPFPVSVTHEYVPGVTTAITFSVRVGSSATVRMNGASTGRLFGGVSAATLVIEEISA